MNTGELETFYKACNMAIEVKTKQVPTQTATKA